MPEAPDALVRTRILYVNKLSSFSGADQYSKSLVIDLEHMILRCQGLVQSADFRALDSNISGKFQTWAREKHFFTALLN